MYTLNHFSTWVTSAESFKGSAALAEDTFTSRSLALDNSVIHSACDKVEKVEGISTHRPG